MMFHKKVCLWSFIFISFLYHFLLIFHMVLFSCFHNFCLGLCILDTTQYRQGTFTHLYGYLSLKYDSEYLWDESLESKFIRVPIEHTESMILVFGRIRIQENHRIRILIGSFSNNSASCMKNQWNRDFWSKIRIFHFKLL